MIALLAALFCVLVAIGAGLQGAFVFSGPRFIPSGPGLPVQHVKPSPQPSLTGVPQPKDPTQSVAVVFSLLPILIVVGVLLLAVILLIIVMWLRRHPRRRGTDVLAVEDMLADSDTGVETDPDLPTLRRGLVRAADFLEADREPRDAIVRAWIGLQEAAEDSGVRRRASETPTEFTSRVFAAVAADREAAAKLLAVYLRVRFGTRPATEADVAAARQAIARLRETWPVGTPE